MCGDELVTPFDLPTATPPMLDRAARDLRLCVVGRPVGGPTASVRVEGQSAARSSPRIYAALSNGLYHVSRCT